jgi:hypothetical protein
LTQSRRKYFSSQKLTHLIRDDNRTKIYDWVIGYRLHDAQLKIIPSFHFYSIVYQKHLLITDDGKHDDKINILQHHLNVSYFFEANN